MKILMSLFVLLSLCCYANEAAFADSAPLQDLIRISAPLTFCGEAVPLEQQQVRERLEKELLLSLQDQAQVLLWLKRSTRYLPEIEKMLKEAGLPDDLKYVAFAESALQPHAGSSKGAIGFWQFVPETAKRYGLRVDGQLDQRRQLLPSTRAARDYFVELYQIFHNWSLAAAAYNMGEEGLRAEMLIQDCDDFYRLYLPLETQRYLFRILSVKLILSEPEKFGFALQQDDYYPPEASRLVSLDCFAETSLTVVAAAAGTDFKQIKDLNPDIRGYYLGPGKYDLYLPASASDDFQERFARLHKDWTEQRSQRIYVVQAGDNLSVIAARFEVPLAALLVWNRLDLKATLHPGDRLVIEAPDKKSAQ